MNPAHSPGPSHIVPILLGTGTRLLQDIPTGKLERTEVVESPTGVTHIEYAILR